MKEIKLLCVSADANSNKFYNMTELGDGTFQAVYGRVGNPGVKEIYPMSKWDAKLKEKIKKGYKDITGTSSSIVKKDVSQNLASLRPAVRDLLEKLNRYAKEAFKLNYTVEISDVSEALVDNAQDIINSINASVEIGADYNDINDSLLRLYNIIPRKIKNVKESLVPSPIKDADMVQKVQEKMAIEQGLLDVVRGQIAKKPTNDGSKTLNYLDSLGLDIEEVSGKEADMLKRMMGSSKGRYRNAYRVTNFKTQRAFDSEVSKSKNKKTMLLFHGSRSENWLNIIKSGLVLHPDATVTGKLFDNGIYFADDADKSLGYISGGRWNNASSNDNWLAVYDVHVGKQARYPDLPSRNVKLDKWVPANGYDSYFADKNVERRYSLRKDEFIVYDEAKCTIKYLIHIK